MLQEKKKKEKKKKRQEIFKKSKNKCLQLRQRQQNKLEKED